MIQRSVPNGQAVPPQVTDELISIQGPRMPVLASLDVTRYEETVTYSPDAVFIFRTDGRTDGQSTDRTNHK